MSTLRFEVHVDKENAILEPSVNKGGLLKNVGPKGDRGKLQQTAPRKALYDVINEPESRNHGGKQLRLAKDGTPSSVKPSHKILRGVENFPIIVDSKKQVSKKTPSLQRLKVLKDAEPQMSKSKTTVTQRKPIATSKPQSDLEITDEDYAIFPKSERLSSYVSKLLTWRPPCLFGELPDSESDDSDLEELPQDGILLDMPLPLPIVPEFSDTDFVNLMNDFPPPKPDYEEHEQGGACLDKDLEIYLDQTLDTSFTFGRLHVMHGNLDISLVSDANSFTDHDHSSL